MTQQIISTGTAANDHTGDTVRVAFGKVNANTTELYSGVAAAQTAAQVNATIQAVVGAAPAALSTLAAIDAQLANDESAASALTTAVAGKLAGASNLSDLASPATARINLGLGTAATHPATDFMPAGTTYNLPVSNTYTASGAILVSDSLSIVNAASAAAMTLANGTVDGHQIVVKRWGAGTVSVAAQIDNAAQTITMASQTVQEALTLCWSAPLASYVLV